VIVRRTVNACRGSIEDSKDQVTEGNEWMGGQNISSNQHTRFLSLRSPRRFRGDAYEIRIQADDLR
jgi:hypothetical protein